MKWLFKPFDIRSNSQIQDSAAYIYKYIEYNFKIRQLFTKDKTQIRNIHIHAPRIDIIVPPYFISGFNCDS